MSKTTVHDVRIQRVQLPAKATKLSRKQLAKLNGGFPVIDLSIVPHLICKNNLGSQFYSCGDGACCAELQPPDQQ